MVLHLPIFPSPLVLPSPLPFLLFSSSILPSSIRSQLCHYYVNMFNGDTQKQEMQDYYHHHQSSHQYVWLCCGNKQRHLLQEKITKHIILYFSYYYEFFSFFLLDSRRHLQQGIIITFFPFPALFWDLRISFPALLQTNRENQK